MTSVHPGTSETLQNYRGVIVEHFATEAGISASKQRTFTFTNYMGILLPLLRGRCWGC